MTSSQTTCCNGPSTAARILPADCGCQEPIVQVVQNPCSVTARVLTVREDPTYVLTELNFCGGAKVTEIKYTINYRTGPSQVFYGAANNRIGDGILTQSDTFSFDHDPEDGFQVFVEVRFECIETSQAQL